MPWFSAIWVPHTITCHKAWDTASNIHLTKLKSSPFYTVCLRNYAHGMMTSSNGNIFRVTGPLCGEFTGPGEIPTQRPVTRSFDVFFDRRLNKRLSKQPRGWWLETLSCSLWRQSNGLHFCLLLFCCGLAWFIFTHEIQSSKFFFTTKASCKITQLSCFGSFHSLFERIQKRWSCRLKLHTKKIWCPSEIHWARLSNIITLCTS